MRLSLDDVKGSMRAGKKESTIRSVAENQLHIAAMMYSDPNNREIQQITLVACSEAEE